MAALSMESNHLNEDHERLMERHSTLLQEMASKEKAARDKHDQLLKLANQAERARQDAVANLQQETEALRQSYRVSLDFNIVVNSYFVFEWI
jgi:recombinational DNA repair ATPase RecF